MIPPGAGITKCSLILPRSCSSSLFLLPLFPFLFLANIFDGCSTKCALLRRSGAASAGVGAFDRPIPAGTHRAPSHGGKSTSGPVKLGKATAKPQRCSYPPLAWILGPHLSGPSSCSVMAGMLGPHPSGPSSSAAISVLPPSGLPPQTRNDSCPRIAEGRSAADAERGLLPQSRKSLGSSSSAAMNGNKERTSSSRCPPSFAMKSASCPDLRYLPR